MSVSRIIDVHPCSILQREGNADPFVVRRYNLAREQDGDSSEMDDGDEDESSD